MQAYLTTDILCSLNEIRLVSVAEISCHGNHFLLAASSILELLKMRVGGWVGYGGVVVNWMYFGISVGSEILFQNRS